jgi:CheY-like chemotaxis protein
MSNRRADLAAWSDYASAAGSTRSRASVVVVADDDVAVRRVVTHALESLGLVVVPVADGAAALGAVKAHRDVLGCVILDLVMPEMDGVEVTRVIRQLRLDVPVVLMRASSEATPMERLGQTRVAALLSKPFSLWVLPAKVAELLAARERQHPSWTQRDRHLR